VVAEILLHLKASPKVRRRFNEAVLKAVYVEDGKVKRAEFTDVFAALFSRPSSNKWVKVPPAGHQPEGNRREQHLCRGSSWSWAVSSFPGRPGRRDSQDSGGHHMALSPYDR